LRGHNIFCGIPDRVQPWFKEMNDMAQIRRFLKQRVPIAGIGVQGHLHAE